MGLINFLWPSKNSSKKIEIIDNFIPALVTTQYNSDGTYICSRYQEVPKEYRSLLDKFYSKIKINLPPSSINSYHFHTTIFLNK
ncbi:MAG: hypothetical protein ACOYT4_01625 [Nanoarchaeota archaeon]